MVASGFHGADRALSGGRSLSLGIRHCSSFISVAVVRFPTTGSLVKERIVWGSISVGTSRQELKAWSLPLEAENKCMGPDLLLMFIFC